MRLSTSTRTRTRSISADLEPRENPRMRDRPPADLHFADDVLLRDQPPGPAVGAVVPVIPHHVVIAGLHFLRPPRVARLVLLRDEVVGQRDVVAIDAPFDAADDVPRPGHDALDE